MAKAARKPARPRTGEYRDWPGVGEMEEGTGGQEEVARPVEFLVSDADVKGAEVFVDRADKARSGSASGIQTGKIDCFALGQRNGEGAEVRRGIDDETYPGIICIARADPEGYLGAVAIDASDTAADESQLTLHG
jgi:hypothetical protein